MANFAEFNSAKVEEELELSGSCNSLTYNQDNKTLLVCNSTENTIEIYEKNEFSCFKNSKPEKEIKLEKGICSIFYDKFKKIILIGCKSKNGILIFDMNFELIKKIGKEINYEYIDSLSMDKDKNDENIYIISRNDNKLAKWNIENDCLIKEMNISIPKNIFIKNDKIFLISQNEELKKDFLFILDKNSFEILNKINLNNERKLIRGISIDDFNNIILTATDEDDKKTINFFVLNSNGKILKEFCLEEIEKTSIISDIIIVNNNIFTLSQELDWEFLLKKISFTFSN